MKKLLSGINLAKYRFNRNQRNRGVSLTELMASTVVGAIVVSATLGGAMFNRQLYSQDEVRTRVNQSLRSAMDMVGADIQQVGENIRRTDPSFPTIELRPDPNNSGSSILTLRRNLADPISICQNLGNFTVNPPTASTNLSLIRVFERDLDPNDNVRPPGNCAELVNEQVSTSAPNIDAILARLESERSTRNGANGTLRMFLYDGGGGGQFINLQSSISTNSNNTNDARFVAATTFNGVQAYSNGTARLYFLEERTFRLNNGNLELIVDGGTPQTLVSGIQRFNVTLFSDPIIQNTALIEHTSFCERAEANRCFDPDPNATVNMDTWSTINHLRVMIIATDPAIGTSIVGKPTDASRTMVEQFYPRNVMNF